MRSLKKVFCLLLGVLLLGMSAIPASAACAHEYVVNVVPVTCTSDGYTWSYCKLCGEALKDDNGEIAKDEIVPAKGHHYGEWSVAQQATCVQEGLWVRTCDYCDTQETKTVPLLEHADLNVDGRCDVCDAEVELPEGVSPFDWFIAFFRTLAEKIRAFFGIFFK